MIVPAGFTHTGALRFWTPVLAGPSASLREVTGLTLLASGKVRELYDLGDDLLMVASDRIST